MTLGGYSGEKEVAGMRARNGGWTLTETLVVIAIIVILMALQMPVFSKALRKAQETSISLTQRDSHMGKMADTANIARESLGPVNSEELRARARAAYDSTLRTGVGDIRTTELVLAVSHDEEFNAYWHTLINPAAAWELEGSLGGGLIVRDEWGQEFLLPLLSQYSGPAVPVSWELISTDLSQTTSGTLGAVVQFSDGRSEYMRYPHGFPISEIVAERTRTYLDSK